MNIVISLLVILMIMAVPGVTIFAEGGREHHAEILEEEITFDIKDPEKARYFVKRKISVYSSEGDRYVGLALDENQFTKVNHFKGRVYNAEGKEIHSYKKSDGVEICGYSGYALYADICALTFWLGARTYPYTAEYEFSKEYNTLFMWPDWHPQQRIPVKSTSYTLITPPDLKFKSRIIGDIPEPAVTEKNNEKMIEYKLADVPAIEDEDYIYSAGDQMMAVRFAPHRYKLGQYQFDGSDWDSLGAGCHTMWHDCFELGEEQKTLVDSIKAESITQKEIADKLHEAIIRSTRYVAIQIGIGGWRPTPAAESFERGYGDCKDLSTMYLSMLRYAGIEAKPALVLTRGRQLTSQEFPCLTFNHAIFFAMVDGDTMWADPTCAHCAMGDLLWYDEDIWVLSFDSIGGRLIRTPASPAAENCVIRKTKIEIGKKKATDVGFEISATGNVYHELQGFLNQSEFDKLEKYLTSSDFGLSKKLKTDSIVVENDDERGTVQKILVQGVMRNAVQTAGKKKYVNLVCLSQLREREKVRLDDRTMPLDLKYPISYSDTVTFSIPRGWQVEKIPEAVDIDSEFGSLEVEYSVDEDELTIACNRISRPYYIPKEKLPQFAEYLGQIEEAVPKHIAFLVD